MDGKRNDGGISDDVGYVSGDEKELEVEALLSRNILVPCSLHRFALEDGY